AGGKAAEEARFRGRLVEVERLRIELRGECLYLVGRHGKRAGGILLPHLEVLEVVQHGQPVCTRTSGRPSSQLRRFSIEPEENFSNDESFTKPRCGLNTTLSRLASA